MAGARLALGMLLVVFVTCDCATANPSSQSPDELLAVRDQAASGELALQARVLLRDAVEETARYEENLASGKYKVGDSRELKNIGLTYNKVTQFARLGARLAALGEPAGADLQLRAAELHARLQALIAAYRDLPKTKELLTNSVAQVQNITRTRGRTVPRLGELFKQGKVDQAEKALNDIYNELEPLTVWHLSNIYEEAYRPFANARSAIDAKVSEMRIAEGHLRLEELREAEDPRFDAVLAEVKASLETVGKTGQAMWRGTQLDGPALLSAWGQAWREVQTKTYRCRAIDWARGIKGSTRPPSELDQLETAYTQFDDKMTASVAELIAADAGRAIPEAIPTLYLQYLDAVATLTPQIASPKWLPAVEAALADLRDKSPQLAKQVESYAQATDEILRWRKRASQAAAKARAAEHSPLEDQWTKVSEQTAMVERKGQAAKPILAFLSTGAPPLVRDAARVNLKQQATVTDLAPAADGAAASRYRNRLSARLPLAKIPEEELVELRKDLLVGPDNPPLTLAAALAIKSAEQGYLQSAGGEIKGLHLESLLVHFITLADNAPHVALGPFPADTPIQEPSTPIEQMTWWYELQPQWLQHEYIFAELP